MICDMSDIQDGGDIGGRTLGMTLFEFLNPAVPLGKRPRHDN